MSDKTFLIPVVAVLTALLTVLVYLPALQYDFVNWDDGDYVYDNHNIESLDIKLIQWSFSSFHAANWHPLTWLSHALDYAIWGLNPMGHHLTSIIFHGLNTFLVILLVVNLLKSKSEEPFFSLEQNHNKSIVLIIGAFTGFLFGLHPLHVESVVWVSERKDVLCTFFVLLSLLAYLRYVSQHQRTRRKIYYTLCLLSFVLALMSKPMAVTLPVVLVILDIYPLNRLELGSLFTSQRRILLEKLPFLLLSILSSGITVVAQRTGKALVPLGAHPFTNQILIAIRAIGFYLFKLIWPAELFPFYPYPSKISFFNIEYLAAILLSVLITILCLWLWRRHKIFLVVWLYFLVTLIPVLGIIQVGSQAAADRYTYLPSLGPFFLIALGIASIYGKLTGRKTGLKQKVLFIPLIFLPVLAPLTFRTLDQMKIWKDPVTFWNYEISKFSGISTLYLSRGQAYAKTGNLQQAIYDYDKAIELTAYDPLNFYNRGIAYGKTGNHRKAIEDFNQAVKLNPEDARFYNELGVAYGNLRDYQKAMEVLDRAVKLDPMFIKAYFYRGVAQTFLGLNQPAIKDFRQAAILGDKEAQRYLTSKGISWRQDGSEK